MQSSVSVTDPSSELFLHMRISDSNFLAHFERTYIECICEGIAKSNELFLSSVMVVTSPILELLPECKTAVPPTIQETSQSRLRELDWPSQVAKVGCKATDSHSAATSSCFSLGSIPLYCPFQSVLTSIVAFFSLAGQHYDSHGPVYK